MVVNYVLLHRGVQKTGRYSDVDGSFNLVTCEHPDFDPCLLHELDGVSHVVLEAVLDGSRSNELEVFFDLAVNSSHLLLSIIHLQFSLVRQLQPIIVHLLVQELLCQKQCPQTFFSELVDEPLSGQIDLAS